MDRRIVDEMWSTFHNLYAHRDSEQLYNKKYNQVLAEHGKQQTENIGRVINIGSSPRYEG